MLKKYATNCDDIYNNLNIRLVDKNLHQFDYFVFREHDNNPALYSKSAQIKAIIGLLKYSQRKYLTKMTI